MFMKIGFDGKRAVQNYTGLGNYSRYIVDILCHYFPQNEYVLYAPKKKDNRRLEEPLSRYLQLHVSYPSHFLEKKLNSLWRVLGLTRQLEEEGIQLFHGLSNELPLTIKQSHIKSIVTIHDLIFMRFPQYYKFIDRKIYAYKFRKACENADKIIAISQCTKRDIVHFFNIPEDKIEVLYQGCDPSFALSADARLKEMIQLKYELPKRYILNVGTVEERKNVLLAVKAVKNLPRDVHLVIIGRRTSYAAEVENYVHAHNLEDRVYMISDVPFVDLPVLYQLAEVFVYPSRFEGFGIPIIEALHSGVPVVAATGSCLEEAGGPDSVYVDPDDVDGLSKALIEILADADKRKEMIIEGEIFVQRFAGNRQAETLNKIYHELLYEE